MKNKALTVGLNARAMQIVDGIVVDAEVLGCIVSRGNLGEQLIDLGANAVGGLEAGRRLAEVCLGGLGTVAVLPLPRADGTTLAVSVHTANPILACLGSQYGGWQLTDAASNFSAIGSGPARAQAAVEGIFDEIGYRETFTRCALVLEGPTAPPAEIVAYVSATCRIEPSQLTILYAQTGSIAGTVQIAARALEVALHKAHALEFPIEDIVDGASVAPISPPTLDFLTAMGRTNDAIIYSGTVRLYVKGTDSAAKHLARMLPSNTSSDYGKPFAKLLTDSNGDFYKIDKMLFSPADVTICNIETGYSYTSGKILHSVAEASFSIERL